MKNFRQYINESDYYVPTVTKALKLFRDNERMRRADGEKRRSKVDQEEAFYDMVDDWIRMGDAPKSAANWKFK